LVLNVNDAHRHILRGYHRRPRRKPLTVQAAVTRRGHATLEATARRLC